MFGTRLGDIELHVVYNTKEWELNWTQYETVIKCTAEWWCWEKDCDLDELDLRELEPDEHCAECPRILSERFTDTGYWGNDHTEILTPKNLEEVRQNILKVYEKLPHNGLNKDNLYKIMYTKWVHIIS